MSVNYLQILEKTVDEFGVHLKVKDKRNGLIHMEGHCLAKKDFGNKAILRERPLYHLLHEFN
jgi:hypothetical protein